MRRAEAQRQLAAYLQRFPAEAAGLAALRAQLDDLAADPFSRANMRGHITTSAFVLSPDLRQLLLIKHRFIGRWLQPGGHYEAGATLWQSALREVLEETGATALSAHAGWGQDLPLDIDSHAIAANPAKGEGAHWHHDYAYLVIAPPAHTLQAQLDEVSGLAWRPVQDLDRREPRFQRLLDKLAVLRCEA